jgi:hypothetical protein
MKPTLKPDVMVSVEDKLPLVGLRVVVVGKHFRCVGSIDRDGIWRDGNNNALKDVIGWFEA